MTSSDSKPRLSHTEELSRRAQVPVSCGSCGTEVLVQKYSFHHTSIQWQADAEQSCAEFREATERGDRSPMEARSCQSLRASIEAAVLDGRVPVPEE